MKEKIKEKIWRAMDAFLVEATDEHGNYRSIDRLNQDRQLFMDRMEEIFSEQEQTTNNSKLINMETKKWYYFYLDMNKPTYRIIRRAIAVGILTAISLAVGQYLSIAPEWQVPILTGILAAVDKALRENKS